MILKLIGEHKSLKAFESEELAKLNIITGKNGSGKSQLIELLTLSARNAQAQGATFTITPKFNKIQAEGIVNNNLVTLNNDNWKAKVDVFVNDYKNIKENSRKLGNSFIECDKWISDFNPGNLVSSFSNCNIDIEEFKMLLVESLREFEPNFFRSNLPFNQIVQRHFTQNYLGQKHKTFLVANYVANYRNKDIEALIDADFYLSPIPEQFLDNPKLFGSQLEYVFYNYAKRRDQNRRLYFEKKEEGEINNSISDKEFIEEFKPPWEWINEILNDHKIDFQFKGIKKSDFSPDAKISFQLIKTTIDKDISFQNLSSGEKVILGLIIKLFTSQYYDDRLELPDLIVLDEPDAHLHPEMSKLLIDVLNQTFVNKLRISVVLVTHSPSTVALSPDDSIYELKNEPETSLKKVEKDQALEILTGHLPTLSIDYKNHKQIFVESPTDVKYYQTIFNKLNQEKNYPFKLYFISNAYGKSNCDQVIQVVNAIRNSGNKTAFGIIDWDLKNQGSDYIKVHGQNKRYNIENYIYDPIYISILLMNMNAHNIFGELEIDQTVNQYSIGEWSTQDLQRICNWYFDKYYSKFSVNDEQKNKIVDVEYLNGKILKFPQWHLLFQGHDLETRIKQLFQSLNGKFISEGSLQKELTLIIGKCFPFVPKDSKTIIEEIINGR